MAKPELDPYPAPPLRQFSFPITILAEPIPKLKQSKTPKVKACPSDQPTAVIINPQSKVIGIYRQYAELEPTPVNNDGLEPAVCLSLQASFSDIEALFNANPFLEYIPLLDKKHRYKGLCISRKRYNDWLSGQLRPIRVGGMATPLGVYMTTGAFNAGAGWPGLIAAGLMFGLGAYLVEKLALAACVFVLSFFPNPPHFTPEELMWFQAAVMGLMACVGIRLSPISRLHAAEHMTIYAIENDLPITPEIVSRQPRAHPRCGTNLVILMVGFELLLFTWSWGYHRLSLLGLLLESLLWIVVVLRSWKPVGLWLQRHFTTQPPNLKQLAIGIRTGEELLQRYAENPHAPPSIVQRLWYAGIVPMACSFLLGWQLISWLANFLIHTML